MLKTNTLLNALSVVMIGLLGFFGAQMWGDVKDTKTATTTITSQVSTISKTVDDHETRIRAAEHDLIRLQEQPHDDNRISRSPKMTDESKH